MRREEDAIQRALVKHIRVRIRPNASFFAVPNGGKRGKLEAAIMKGLGTRAGVPDIFVVVDGKVIFLELKAPKGRVSPEQLAMHNELRRAGCEVYVVRSLDEAVAILERVGALRESSWVSSHKLNSPKNGASRVRTSTSS